MSPAFRLVVAAAAGALLASCASAPGAAPPCAGMSAPRRLTTAPVALPSSYTAARLGGIVVDEAVIGTDGSVSGIRVVRARWELLAPFAQKSVEDSLYDPMSIEGNPVATRVQIATTLGPVSKAPVEPEYDLLWAHVPGGQSREAVWQLAGSVQSLTLAAHAGTGLTAGGEIVARAPDGKELVLLKLPPSEQPVDVRETVSTGKFFSKAGDYPLELRAGGRTLAWTTVTIADDYTRAIVNACEPI